MIGLFSTAVLTVSWFPQLIRVWGRRSAADLSYAYLLLLLVGFTGWLVYGLILGLLAVIVSNSIAILNALTLIILKYRFDREMKNRVGLIGSV